MVRCQECDFYPHARNDLVNNNPPYVVWHWVGFLKSSLDHVIDFAVPGRAQSKTALWMRIKENAIRLGGRFSAAACHIPFKKVLAGSHIHGPLRKKSPEAFAP